MKAPSAAHAAAYGPFNSPSPISTPTANSSGSAGTTAPSTITASQNAIAKITSPAASGCAPIHATSWSNYPFGIGGLYGADGESSALLPFEPEPFSPLAGELQRPSSRLGWSPSPVYGRRCRRRMRGASAASRSCCFREDQDQVQRQRQRNHRPPAGAAEAASFRTIPPRALVVPQLQESSNPS